MLPCPLRFYYYYYCHYYDLPEGHLLLRRFCRENESPLRRRLPSKADRGLKLRTGTNTAGGTKKGVAGVSDGE